MSFRSPETLWWLCALIPIAGLWVATEKRRRTRTERVGNPDTLQALVVGSAKRLRIVKVSLMLGGLALLLLALAGPRYGSKKMLLRKRGIDIVLVLDVSKSMLAEDIKPNRLARTRAELIDLITELSGDRIGAVAFAGETLEFPLTTDASALGLFLRDLGPSDMPVGGTAIGRALTAAGRLLERSSVSEKDPEAITRRRSQAILLVTDGGDHEGDPSPATEELARKQVPVFVVGVGLSQDVPIPRYLQDGTRAGFLRDFSGNRVLTSLSGPQEAQLKQIASETNGKYFRTQRSQLGLHRFRSHIRNLKQTEHKSRVITIHQERYMLAVLAALLLLFAEALLPESWHR